MKLRLAPDAAQALAQAVTEARRCRHAEVTREHLLAVFLAADALWPTLTPLRFYRREVSALVASRLAALPTTGGYRDGLAAPPVSPALRAFLLRQQRGILVPRSTRASDLLDALLDDRVIALLIAEARLDLDVLDSALARAMMVAGEHRHIAIRPEHVFRVLLDERWFGRLLQSVDADLDVFRERLDASLASYAAVGKRSELFPTKALARIVERSTSHAKALRRPATAELFIVFALQDAEACRVFDEAAIDRFRLLEAVVDGVAPSVEGASAPAEVVFHNDNVTTQQFVVAVLTSTFDLPEPVAIEVMIRVHGTGEAPVGVYPEVEARVRVRVALARARNAGFPLRITVRTASGA